MLSPCLHPGSEKRGGGSRVACILKLPGTSPGDLEAARKVTNVDKDRDDDRDDDWGDDPAIGCSLELQAVVPGNDGFDLRPCLAA